MRIEWWAPITSFRQVHGRHGCVAAHVIPGVVPAQHQSRDQDELIGMSMRAKTYKYNGKTLEQKPRSMRVIGLFLPVLLLTACGGQEDGRVRTTNQGEQPSRSTLCRR